jgi:4-aminobutyrate aminotransferase
VRQACNDNGTLLIFDEIPTGLGKTGKMFACEHDAVVPDILVLGKALGGGILPIAAVLAKAELDVGGEFAFGHYTHEKNPVTAKAALTTIEIIEQEGLVENAAKLGKYMLEQLNLLKAEHSTIGDVRGRGLLIGVELVLDRVEKTPANDLAEDVLYRCLGKGLSFKITMGNVLTLTPPLMIRKAQIDLSLSIINESLREAENIFGLTD